MLIKKGMTVRVVSGAHTGMEGKVLFVSPKKQRVIIEGVNFIKKSPCYRVAEGEIRFNFTKKIMVTL